MRREGERRALKHEEALQPSVWKLGLEALKRIVQSPYDQEGSERNDEQFHYAILSPLYPHTLQWTFFCGGLLVSVTLG